jgi:hypothetical protein
MRTYFTSALLGFALVAGAPVANAQSLVMSPNEFFDSPPSGTLLGPMPMVDVSSGVLRPTQTVETIQTAPVALPSVRHQVVASHHTTVHIAASVSWRPLYNYVGRAPTVRRIVVPAIITRAPIISPGQVLNLSGQFLCVEGCAGGRPGLAFVTQNGWDINLVNELGQPTRAWVDWPGHIWALNWNEGAVYSPDGMTIQFDNGTVWRRNIELLALPSASPSPHGR